MFDADKYSKLVKKIKCPTESDIRRAIRNAKGIPGVTKTVSVGLEKYPNGMKVVEVLDKCGKIVDMVEVPN